MDPGGYGVARSVALDVNGFTNGGACSELGAERGARADARSPVRSRPACASLLSSSGMLLADV